MSNGSMTRQQFQLIANVLADSYGRQAGNTTRQSDVRREEIRDIAFRFASALRSTNDRFDADKFIAACAVES